MPLLIEETQIQLVWDDIDNMVPKQRVDSGKRSSGVHLSGIIKHVLVTAGLLTPDDITDLMPLRMAVGMAWEAFVVQLWPDLIWQPGECCKDDIYGSPDGITHMGSGTVLEEFKATWKSKLEKTETKGVLPPPRNILNQKAWIMQMAGYCHMMNLTHARLHVLWVNGDYRQSGPQYYTYLLSFTKEELERMWTMMVLPNIAGAVAESHQ